MMMMGFRLHAWDSERARNFLRVINWKKCHRFAWIYESFNLRCVVEMNLCQPQSGCNGLNMIPSGQGQFIQGYSVPVQNAFGLLGELVGLSMGVNGDNGNYESMDFQTA